MLSITNSMDINLSKEQLENIYTAASLLFAPEDIATMIGIPAEYVPLFKRKCLHRELGGEIYTSYQKGKLEQEMLIRKAILQSARNGSPPAQALAEKMITKQKMDEK